METLSLKDDRLYGYGTLRPKPRRMGHRQPRLPTPEPSRSSVEAHESGYTSESMQNDNGKHVTLRPLPDEQIRGNDGNVEYSSSRFERFERKAPHSPPYEALDERRPSLPPLKTILGDKMSSPPRTPNIHSAHLQPTPCEPMYTAATYKPPSLYPNKKQKTEQLQPVPPFGSVSFLSPRPNLLESHIGATFSSNMTFPSSNGQYIESTRRQPMQRSERLCRTQSPRSFLGTPPRRHYTITPTNSAQPYHGQQYQASEQTPVLNPSEQSTAHSTLYAERDTRTRRTQFRRASSSTIDTYHSRPNEDQVDRNLAQHNDRAYASPTLEHFRGREEFRVIERTERDSIPPCSEMVRGPYQSAPLPDDFAAVPFEYFYTKARKRSNLPKHSTEIMRAWFDQNIANPYPSEDQKALFATATGISLTQVSNWFINHRRRCPELRDKRVERRKP